MVRSHSETVTLVAAAADEATEIFFIDASLRRIASGVGELSQEVPIGIYKVRFRSGARQHDILADALQPGARVEICGPSIPFAAAAPLDQTLTARPAQVAAATRESKEPHLRIGRGGSLLLFVREEQEGVPPLSQAVTIHDLDGQRLTSLEGGAKSDGEGWAALHIEVNPGTYAVRVQSGSLGDYQIFATVCRGFQTQVFLVSEELWSRGEPLRAPALRSASIHMRRHGAGFDPADRSARLTELARHALGQGRQVLEPGVLRRLLSKKSQSPMAGLLGAHLLLLQHRPNRDLLDFVITSLTAVLGADHPDLRALHMSERGDGRRPLERPPMLRASWDRVVQQSRRAASLVPPESLLSRIAGDLVPSGPWLIHRLQPRVPRTEAASIAQATRTMLALLGANPEQLQRATHSFAAGDRARLTSLERSVLASVRAEQRAGALGAATDEPEEAQARRVLWSLSAPSYAAAEAVVGLARKLDLLKGEDP